MSAQYNNDGRVSLWRSENETPNAPVFKGKVYAHRDIRQGEELSVSLWENSSPNPKAPQFTGKLQDKQVAPARERDDLSRYPQDPLPTQQAAATSNDPNDDIPF